MVHKHTYSQEGLKTRGDGILIDIYPVVGLPDDHAKIEKFIKRADRLYSIRYFSFRMRSWVMRHSTYNYFPINRYLQRRFRDYLYHFEYKENGSFFVTPNPRWQHVFHENLFEETMDVPFEDHTFSIITKYDTFLSQRYGDYMQLPPEEERVPIHDFHFYWNEGSIPPKESR